MPRYKFAEQRDAVKKNAKHVLPADINKPVLDYLESIGCEIGVKIVKDMQEHVNYGRIELVHKEVPNASISVQVDCGMAEGYVKHESKTIGPWTAYTYKSIKNSNLDKSKPKEVQNGKA